MKKRISEIDRGLSPDNHYKTIDAAKLVGMSYLNVHTPADNLVAKFIQNKIEKSQAEDVGDVIKALLEIEEYRQASILGAGPKIFVGHRNNFV